MQPMALRLQILSATGLVGATPLLTVFSTLADAPEILRIFRVNIKNFLARVGVGLLVQYFGVKGFR
jgi:hypothetical protein